MYTLNILPSPDDERDYHFRPEFAASSLVPPTLDLRDGLLPVRDQGKQGTCFACSCAAMKEYQDRQTEYLSPQFFYNLRSNILDTDPTNDEGMFPRDALRLLRQKGMCREVTFPYKSMGDIPPEAFTEALDHRIGSYVRIERPEELQASLFYHGPALICFPVYNTGMQMWRTNINGQYQGGHAMLVVGYDQDGFHLQNSWGSDWGNGGYTYYPLFDWTSHWECWSVVDDTNSADVEKKPSHNADLEEDSSDETGELNEEEEEEEDYQWQCPSSCTVG